MGLWSWMLEKITEPEGGQPTPSRKANARLSGGSAVATLEAQDENGTSAQAEEAKWWAPANAIYTEAQPVKQPDLSPEIKGLENIIVTYFDGHDLNIPPLLQIAEQILSKLKKPKTNLRDIADKLAEDQILAASTLRMANSPLYRGVDRIAALQPAVTRLGTKAIRTLLVRESMRAATFQGTESHQELADLLWLRSYASAHIMSRLAPLVGTDPEDSFLVGLLHDIGSVVVLRIVSKYENVCPNGLDLDTFDYLCYESHQEFGELLATDWNLPQTVRELITDHHRFPSEDDPAKKERLQLQLSDMLCSMLGYATQIPYDLMNSDVVCALGLSDQPKFIRLLEKLPAELAEEMEES